MKLVSLLFCMAFAAVFAAAASSPVEESGSKSELPVNAPEEPEPASDLEGSEFFLLGKLIDKLLYKHGGYGYGYGYGRGYGHGYGYRRHGYYGGHYGGHYGHYGYY